jgi:hypothetical protein
LLACFFEFSVDFGRKIFDPREREQQHRFSPGPLQQHQNTFLFPLFIDERESKLAPPFAPAFVLHRPHNNTKRFDQGLVLL